MTPILTDSLTRSSHILNSPLLSQPLFLFLFLFLLSPNPGLANCVATIRALCFAPYTVVFLRITFDVFFLLPGRLQVLFASSHAPVCNSNGLFCLLPPVIFVALAVSFLFCLFCLFLPFLAFLSLIILFICIFLQFNLKIYMGLSSSSRTSLLFLYTHRLTTDNARYPLLASNLQATAFSLASLPRALSLSFS